jgi:hypothetical protein
MPSDVLPTVGPAGKAGLKGQLNVVADPDSGSRVNPIAAASSKLRRKVMERMLSREESDTYNYWGTESKSP